MIWRSVLSWQRGAGKACDKAVEKDGAVAKTPAQAGVGTRSALPVTACSNLRRNANSIQMPVLWLCGRPQIQIQTLRKEPFCDGPLAVWTTSVASKKHATNYMERAAENATKRGRN